MHTIDRLDPELQQALRTRVAKRQALFSVHAKKVLDFHHRVLLVGDRPAPSAPNDPTFHYTPFGALTNSSLWLNLQLEAANISEDALGWINAFDLYGAPSDLKILQHPWITVIALGGKAAAWVERSDIQFDKVHHPQAWKRFHSKRPYPLINLIQQHLRPQHGM